MARAAIAPMAGPGAPWLTGALALLQLLTIAPAVPFTFPEPLSAVHALLVAAFLATFPFVVPVPPRHPVGVAAHLALTGLALAVHPMALFGRDGSAIVLAAHFFTVLGLRTRLPPELTLAAVSTFAGLLASETVFARLPAVPPPPPGVLDYGDLMLADDSPGALRPALDVRIVTERGTGRFVTDSRGHRNAREVTLRKRPGVYRVLLIGDSFASGYRVDQEAFLGARLERELQARRPEPEVVVTGAGHPGYARRVLERKGLRLSPDAVVLGLTLGNDLQSSWIARQGLPGSVLADFFMPDDAYRGRLALLPLALDRSLSSWRTYRRLASLLRPDTIAPWYPEAPRHVALLDPAHGLGFFYTRRQLPIIARSIEATLAELAAMRDACEGAGVRFVVALFPQRFQASPREWLWTLRERGLDPGAFDPEAPNRALDEGCRARGLECVDLLPDLRRSCEDPCYLPQGDMHWNEHGHAVAAATLARALAP
ncbi:MAG TPA: hypothetical protein VLF95_10235 [Vicinamibacteria bacterium]|nr:hypothetical protein [Vicinamibacteria bacterium]